MTVARIDWPHGQTTTPTVAPKAPVDRLQSVQCDPYDAFNTCSFRARTLVFAPVPWFLLFLLELIRS